MRRGPLHVETRPNGGHVQHRMFDMLNRPFKKQRGEPHKIWMHKDGLHWYQTHTYYMFVQADSSKGYWGVWPSCG